MPKLPTATAKETINALKKIGFIAIRQKDIRLKNQNNQVVTIPFHGNKNLGKGLLRKILRDAEITVGWALPTLQYIITIAFLKNCVS